MLLLTSSDSLCFKRHPQYDACVFRLQGTYTFFGLNGVSKYCSPAADGSTSVRFIGTLIELHYTCFCTANGANTTDMKCRKQRQRSCRLRDLANRLSLRTHQQTRLLWLPTKFNPLKTKRRLLYLNTQSVPRSKHFSSRL